MRYGRVKLQAACMAAITAALVSVQAFEMPSSAQVRAAADNPAALAQLAQGASPEQAAAILTGALAELLAKNMEADDRIDLARQLTARFMGLFPRPQQDEFAQALGRLIGGNAALRAQNALVSAVQGAVAQGNGDVAQLFAVAYMDAAGIGVAASGRPDNTPSQVAPPVTGDKHEMVVDDDPPPPPPPPPPVAPTYPNQPCALT